MISYVYLSPKISAVYCINKILKQPSPSATYLLWFILSFVGEEISDDTHALWAMSCDWYAQYLLNNGRYQEALAQFEQAYIISEKLFGDTHPQTLVILNSLGE